MKLQPILLFIPNKLNTDDLSIIEFTNLRKKAKSKTKRQETLNPKIVQMEKMCHIFNDYHYFVLNYVTITIDLVFVDTESIYLEQMEEEIIFSSRIIVTIVTS